MEENSLEVRLLNFARSNKFTIILGLIGIVSFIFGIQQLFRKEMGDIAFQKAPQGEGVTTNSAQTKQIYIDVSGEVIRPGVYKIAEGARVQDAITAAGGLTDQSDKTYVSRALNLAQKLSDGAKLYIPKQGEAQTTSQLSSTTLDTVSNIGKVNINTASLGALDALPGIGPVTADKIISGRPYSDNTDLLSKKIVTSKVFEKIKDLISVY